MKLLILDQRAQLDPGYTDADTPVLAEDLLTAQLDPGSKTKAQIPPDDKTKPQVPPDKTRAQTTPAFKTKAQISPAFKTKAQTTPAWKTAAQINVGGIDARAQRALGLAA